MQTKPQLVLDIAGVLVTNLSTAFWQELAVSAGTTFQTLREHLNTIRQDLWTGNMKEDIFGIG
jgi:predicted transcriptional regulator